MFEPNPPVCEQLISNHAHTAADLTFEMKAVGAEGNFTLYWCKEHLGMASTHREHVRGHIKGDDWQIQETIVEMIPFEKVLEQHPDFAEPDLLLLDTEGWDAEILLSIDFSKFNCSLIIFEKEHIKAEQYLRVREHLTAAGYIGDECKFDCVAIKKNSGNPALEKVQKHAYPF